MPRWWGRLRYRLIAAGLVAVVANVVGLARLPIGPIASDDGPGGSFVGNSELATDIVAGSPMWFGMLDIVNDSPYEVVLEAVRILPPAPNVAVDRVAVAGTSLRGQGEIAWAAVASGIGMARMDAETESLPVVSHPARIGVLSTNVILILHGQQPGNGGFDRVELLYRVGPFTFRAIQHIGLRACFGPLPPGAHCVDDEAPTP